MPHTLSCYYLDDPLTNDERGFVEQSLLGPWAKFKTGAGAIVEKRVPLVLPAPDADGKYIGAPEERAELIRGNLRHAGIRADAGRQVLWVMPRDSEWDAIFQFAIREETGFAPFVAQRWYRSLDQVVRGEIRVIDTQMLIEGLQ